MARFESFPRASRIIGVETAWREVLGKGFRNVSWPGQARAWQGTKLRAITSKHLEIFALLPVRHFGLKALDLGVLDVDIVVDKAGAQRVAKERIVF